MGLHGIHVIYKRPSGLIVVRDRVGNRVYFKERPFQLQRTDSAGFAWYGRVDFLNRRRFRRYARSQQSLEAALMRLPAAQIKDSGGVPLPISRSYRRREANQGMRAEMDVLALLKGYNHGNKYDATSYANWVNGRLTRAYEWCHLIAHSMGGRDRAENVVAAARGNNSEQLAIENILSAYRTENIFGVRVQAGLHDQGRGKHLATVIRYRILNLYRISNRVDAGLDIFLDASVSAMQPSAIHQYLLIRALGTWLNKETVRQNDKVPRATKILIRDYLKRNREDLFEEEEEDGI